MQAIIDTTKAPIDSWYIKSVGSVHHLVFEHDNERADLIIPDEQFNRVHELISKECGEKTYSEIEDENIKLKGQVEEYKYQKSLDEEYEDVRREKQGLF